jgi:hypothetical protein
MEERTILVIENIFKSADEIFKEGFGFFVVRGFDRLEHAVDTRWRLSELKSHLIQLKYLKTFIYFDL